jgi:hypothetical protein
MRCWFATSSARHFGPVASRSAAHRRDEDSDRLIRDAIRLHVESLRAHGEAIPSPSTAAVRMVEVV